MTPPELADAMPMDPRPQYALWWAAVEECSGVRSDFGAVRWSTIPTMRLLPGSSDSVSAMFVRAEHRIVLVRAYVNDGPVVRHEMLHALLGVGGHPAAAFRDRCGNVVSCTGSCARDVGAPPPIAADAVPLDVRRLALAVDVRPAAAPDDSLLGWTVVVVRATNPLDRPARVLLAGPLNASDYRLRFGYMVQQVGNPDRAADMATIDSGPAIGFAPNETKEAVFDVRTWGLRPGAYAARGAFNADTTAPAPFMVTPRSTARPSAGRRP